MDPLYRAAVKGKVERKFEGKQDLQSKARPKQSMSAEREYKRLAREVDMAVIEAVKEALPISRRRDMIHYILTAGGLYLAILLIILKGLFDKI